MIIIQYSHMDYSHYYYYTRFHPERQAFFEKNRVRRKFMQTAHISKQPEIARKSEDIAVFVPA